MEKKETHQRKTAIAIMVCAILAYMLLNFTSCVKTTGNAQADMLIEDFVDIYPHDNIAEEMLEQQVKHYTGIDFDFTPASRE